jgi:hypothetical protein
MSIQEVDNSWFCNFIEAGLDTYICSKCGNRIMSEDGPPPLMCSMPSSKTDEEQLASFSTKVKSFINAASGHLQNGAKLCSDEQIEKRYSICHSCEHFVNSSCNKCGCPIVRNKRFISKLSWASSECPVGKWGKED